MTSLGTDQRLLLVGAGKMGTALLRGWLDNSVLAPHQIAVVEPSPGSDLKKTLSDYDQLSVGTSVSAFLSAAPDIVVLAVKPQIMAEAVADLKEAARENTLFVSIAAGLSLSGLKDVLNAPAARIVRTMPNTPVTIGEGVTAYVAAKEVTSDDFAVVETLLGSVGKVVRLSDEKLMDSVTAVSGSGPAYVFLFIEALISAAEKSGLPKSTATELALQTVLGAAKLAATGDAPPEELREQVTSPNGTTEAALEKLMKDGQFQDLLNRAVEAARARSVELSKL